MRSRTQNLVEIFHEKFGHPIDHSSLIKETDFCHLRCNLIQEETDELIEEVWNCCLQQKITPNLLKEMGDLQYVLDGLAVAIGVDLHECTKRVHESNMSKLMPDGTVKRRGDGKVLKGPNYKEPDMKDLIP